MSAGDWKDLLRAVFNNDPELVKYHIQNGVDPNYQHPELLTTPLIEAVKLGNIEIAHYLVQNGADPNLKAIFDNKTPLEIALDLNNPTMVDCLVKHGALLPKRGLWESVISKTLKR